MRKIILIALILSFAFPAYAEDIYVGQSAAGGDTGVDCANQKAASWFNALGSWGAGAGKISAGDVVHLCGTISTGLDIRGDGTAGRPVTILWETNAKLSAAAIGANEAWIELRGHDYLIFDGGKNGIIENTDNGDVLGNHLYPVYGFLGSGGVSTDIEIKNLTIRNLYVKEYGNLDYNPTLYGILFSEKGGTNIYIHDNVINNTEVAIMVQNASNSTKSNINIYNNVMTKNGWGISVISGGANSATDGVNIYNNDITVGANWVRPEPVVGKRAYHLNGMYLYGSQTYPAGEKIENVKIFNNYIHGEVTPDGAWTCSGFIHADYFNAVTTYFLIFNNLLAGVSGDCSPGPITLGFSGTNVGIYNNTIVGYNKTFSANIGINSNSGMIVKNNIIKHTRYGAVMPSGRGDYDNNIYFEMGSKTAKVDTTEYSSLASWQTYLLGGGSCTGTAPNKTPANDECNGLNSDPLLDATYKLQDASPAIRTGTNLTNLGITELNSDKNGVARPSSGPWDIGAYRYDKPSRR